jgi:hypothetical protein
MGFSPYLNFIKKQHQENITFTTENLQECDFNSFL